jgi:hypothetical protein
MKFPINGAMARCEPIAAFGEDKMSVFGFSTAPSEGGGDFLPILKYDARAGRFFRMDRVDTGNGFTNEPIDVTQGIKFVADFENVEVGWINFPAGSAPDFRLVPMGTQLPDRPTPVHKNGLRFMMKLAPECGGDKPVREIAGVSKAFLSGVEAVYVQYLAKKGENPGKLPVLIVEKITPVKTGTGERSSTNYHPTFKISGWAPRPKDLVFEAKVSGVASPSTAPSTAPSTGSTRAEAPKTAAPEMADDFG